jgi:hypothetical protein
MVYSFSVRAAENFIVKTSFTVAKFSMKNNLVVEKKKVSTTPLENQYFFTRNET